MPRTVWAQPIRDVLQWNGRIDDRTLANKSGVSPRAIAKAREGHRIDIDTADKLCIALGYSLAQLYGDGEGTPTPADRAKHDAARAKERARAASRRARAAGGLQGGDLGGT